MERFENIAHTFPPVCDGACRILILGTFPSVRSRREGFYYGHPHNRFWRVLAGVLGERAPETADEKTEMLLRNHIALWDVAARCSLEGSSDATIADVVPNDIASLIAQSEISAVFTNGAKAHELYKKYAEGKTGISARRLPSTSPANAAWSLEKLRAAWSAILADRT